MQYKFNTTAELAAQIKLDASIFPYSVIKAASAGLASDISDSDMSDPSGKVDIKPIVKNGDRKIQSGVLYTGTTSDKDLKMKRKREEMERLFEEFTAMAPDRLANLIDENAA